MRKPCWGKGETVVEDGMDGRSNALKKEKPGRGVETEGFMAPDKDPKSPLPRSQRSHSSEESE